MKYTGMFLFICCLLTTLFAEKPQFSSKRGFYEVPFDLVLTTKAGGQTIQYTLDGSDPRISSTAISSSEPVIILINPQDTTGRYQAPGVVVRAYIMTDNAVYGDVATHTYLFMNDIVTLSPDGVSPGAAWPPQNKVSDGRQDIDYGIDPGITDDPRYTNQMIPAMLAVPSLSLVTDLDNLFSTSDGIYMHAYSRGIEWERPASLELLNPDGSDGFQVNTGVRIRGGYSRSTDNPKHAFRFFFRAEYGDAELNFPLFGDEGVDEFDKVDLRTSQNYSWSFDGSSQNTMVREVFNRDIQGAMGMPYTRSRYYHLFINGVYWGLFQTQERSEASYAEAYFGGDRDDYDVVKVNAAGGYVVEATDGTLTNWNQLWQYCETGFETDEIYFKVQGLNPDRTVNPAYPKLVDVENLINYMLCTFYVGDFDAPISNFLSNNRPNNFYGIYNRRYPNGFIFFRHDGEHTLFDRDWGYDRTGPFPCGDQAQYFNPQWLHQKLSVHPEYRLRMTDLIHRHFFNGGVFTEESARTRFLNRKEEIDLAIIAESARWGDSKRSTPYNREDHWLPEIAFVTNDWMTDRTEIVLGQLINKGWYANIEPPQFNLQEGEILPGTELTMTTPAGKIYYTLDNAPVHQFGDVTITTLLPANADKHVLVPASDIGRGWITDSHYDFTGWEFCSGNPGGVGYENDQGYENMITLDVGSQMSNGNTSCYVRIPFTVSAEDLNSCDYLTLRVLYDDGFAAYLNGDTKIAEAFTPAADLVWNSTASENHEASIFESFDVSAYIDQLTAGNNYIAIHALNVSATSSDFVINAELAAGSLSGGAGIISPSALEYTGPVAINHTVHVKARVLLNNKWSPSNELRLWLAEDAEDLVINEIHYNPLDEEEVDGNEFEFIELKNMGVFDINLSYFYFSNGIGFTFPMGSILKAGDYLVLASNRVAFEERYGFAPFGEFSGQLNNGGERITLNTANGDTLLSIRYNDKEPWPITPDGMGYSLCLDNDTTPGDYDKQENWFASETIHGSPGAENTVTDITPPQPELPDQFILYQNFPNPFNPVTTIRFTIPKQIHVDLTIFNILGAEVDKLIDDNLKAGRYETAWDAAPFASGIYFYQLNAGTFLAVKKLIVLK
jgi:hypothetical protein